MSDLKFNIYAMSNPQTMEDYLALMEEALATIEYLNEVLAGIVKMIGDDHQAI